MRQRKNPVTLAVIELLRITPMVLMTSDLPKLMYLGLWYPGEHSGVIENPVSYA